MDPSTICRTSRPARDVLRYFLRNPATADSLEGIARWRLLEQVIHRNLLQTRQAIDWLVEHEYLVEVSGLASVRMFRLNPAKRDEAELLVSRTGEPRLGA